MVEVVSLHRYPMTGGAAQDLGIASVAPSGIVGDREVVLYDDSGNEAVKPRISQLRNPKLATVAGVTTASGVEVNFLNYGNFYTDACQSEDIVFVNEFGDATPCHDLGDAFARRFSQFLAKDGVRAAIKTHDWVNGGVVDPSVRKNRPLHIATLPTLRAINAMAPGTDFTIDRFRPSIVLDGEIEPFAENEWVGRVIKIGGLPIRISKLTARCPVPGYDQRKGVNLKDVPKTYAQLPKNQANKPVMGIYGYAVLSFGAKADIKIGDEVTV